MSLGCQTATYMANQTGITSGCSPHGGKFEFTFTEVSFVGTSCGPRKTETREYHRSNVPEGLEVNHSLCELSGTIHDNKTSEFQELDLSFNEDWTEANGTVRIITDSCNSLYDIEVIRK